MGPSINNHYQFIIIIPSFLLWVFVFKIILDVNIINFKFQMLT